MGGTKVSRRILYRVSFDCIGKTSVYFSAAVPVYIHGTYRSREWMPLYYDSNSSTTSYGQRESDNGGLLYKLYWLKCKYH